MKRVFTLLNSKLWIKVLIPVSLSVVMVMGVSLWMSIRAQNRLGQDQLTTQNITLARAIEGGMFEALAVGDNDTVRTQFRQLKEKVSGLKVYVYDFNRVVSFSTEDGAMGRSMDTLASRDALDEIEGMIKTGNASQTSVEMAVGEEYFVIKSDPILNEQRCFHCHGSSRKVLGGISVLSSMAEMTAGIQKSRNTSIAVFLAGLCLIIFMVWLVFYLLVNNKVRQVLDVAARLRQKDFSREVDVKKGDEINHILNRLNLVTGELRETIRQIIEGSDALDKASNKMTGIAGTLDASSSQTSRKASNVSAAAEEMSTNNAAIAQAMTDATETLNAIAAAVDEMTTTVGEISKNASESKTIIEDVVESFEGILAAVENLGVRAADVDQVTDEIRSISEQVSLLALNAKIEAARAGEAGKGFAVVAQEITELAQDTSTSTLKADERLAGIKTTVKDLIGQVTSLSGNVRESDDAISGIAASVEEQNATTQEIARNINDVNAKISNVSDSVSQGAQVASEIAQDIVAVEEMSSKVQDESHTLNNDARSLSEMAENFSRLMKQFKI